MTTNYSPYVPIHHPQHDFIQNAQTVRSRDHEHWSNEHLPGVDAADPYPVVNHGDALPQARYTGNMGDDGPPHVAIGLEQYRGQRQLDADHHNPGITTQYIPIDPGPPPLEHYAPAIPEVPNNYPAGNMSPQVPYNVAGSCRGDLSLVHSAISVTEDLKKNLASHDLHNPGSRISDLRTRRSRSGAVKVLILLEIDDDM